MRFADPELLALLALLPLFAWLLRRDGRRHPASLRLPSLTALPAAGAGGRSWRSAQRCPGCPSCDWPPPR